MTSTSALLANGFGRIPRLIGSALADLNEEQLATIPAPGANSMAWLAWHTARGQDAWVSELRHVEQRWSANGWFEKFDLPFGVDENGFGMSWADSMRVRSTKTLLSDYLLAVSRETVAYVNTLSDLDLDDIVDATRTPVVSRGTQLMSILDDGLQHAGQAGYARGIITHA